MRATCRASAKLSRDVPLKFHAPPAPTQAIQYQLRGSWTLRFVLTRLLTLAVDLLQTYVKGNESELLDVDTDIHPTL